MAAILALGSAAVGRRVLVKAGHSSQQLFRAYVTGAPPGQGFVVVQYEGGTETELHQVEEGQQFFVQLAV